MRHPFQVLLSHFDAFKFPSSEIVQFRALVTPCMPTCEPVQCDQEDSSGELRSVQSYGRRRRRRSTSTHAGGSSAREDMLLVQSIHITDKFGFDRSATRKSNMTTSTNDNSAIFISDATTGGFCINVAGIIVAGTVFLAAQLAVIAAWTFIWQRRRKVMKHQQDAMSVSVSVPGLSVARTDSLCKLYDTGYARRFWGNAHQTQ